MSFLPYHPTEGTKYDPSVSRVPRCPRCERVMDGEAEVAGAEVCTSCQGIIRSHAKEGMAEAQRRIEEALE